MIRLFIFSNSFKTYILVKSVEYFFNNTIKEIIILQENNDDELEKIYDSHIVLCNKLKSAVELSDIVIVWDDVDIPQESVKLIENLCVTNKKTYFNIPFSLNEYSNVRDIENIIPNLCNCPVLLNISIGLGTLQPYVELVLNNIISSTKIDFKQYYSPITQKIFKSINDTNLISIKEHSSFFTNLNSEAFSIVSLSVPNIEELYKYIDIFHKIRPDFVIVQTSLDYIHFEDLLKSLNNICLIKCNILIESNYRVINNEWMVNCGIRNDKKNNTLNVDASDLKDDLLKRIVSHFSLPEGIKRF